MIRKGPEQKKLVKKEVDLEESISLILKGEPSLENIQKVLNEESKNFFLCYKALEQGLNLDSEEEILKVVLTALQNKDLNFRSEVIKKSLNRLPEKKIRVIEEILKCGNWRICEYALGMITVSKEEKFKIIEAALKNPLIFFEAKNYFIDHYPVEYVEYVEKGGEEKLFNFGGKKKEKR